MVYRKTYKRRTTYRRKQPWYKKKYNAMEIAGKALAGVKKLKGIINSELLKNDVSLSLAANQSRILLISNMAQGDGVSGRTGNSVLAKYLSLKGSVIINSTVASNTRVMLALVQDTQQISDILPTIADIFQSSTDPHTFLNKDTVGRFRILKRVQYTLNPVGGGRNVVTVNMNLPIDNHIRWNGSAGGDVQKNGLYWVVITSENANYPTIDMTARLTYYDN